MSKLVIADINADYGATASINTAFDDIETAFENTLSRDGTAPNAMSAEIDMGSNPINNLSAPTNNNSAARLQDILDNTTSLTATSAVTTSITDSRSYYTASNVEAALEELGEQFVKVDSKTEAQALVLTSVDQGKKVFISADDGGIFTVEYNATPSTYSDNGGTYTGTVFIPSGGDGTIGIVRDYSGAINAGWFGAKYDGATDDSAALSAAASHLYSTYGGGTIEWIGDMALKDTVLMKVGVSLRGMSQESSSIVILSGGTIASSGYIFYLNTDDGSTTLQEFPAKVPGILERFNINNSNTVSGIRAFLFHGGYKFINIQTNTLAQFVNQMSFYSDAPYFEKIHYATPSDQTTYYAIDLSQGLGDGLYFNQVSFPTLLGAETNGIKISQSQGGAINNIFNGNHLIETSRGLTWEGDHVEGGHITVDRTSMIFDGGFHYNGSDSTPPIKFIGTGEVLNRHIVMIKNRAFVVQEDLIGEPGSADIQTHTSVTVNIENCYRLISQTGAVSKSTITGITVQDSSSVAMDDFNNYSHIASRKCEIFNDVPTFNVNIQGLNAGASAGLTATTGVLDTTWAFTGATDTYYYNVQLLLDPIRLVGKDGATERSVAVTNGAGSPSLVLDLDDYSPMCMIRVYRGTTTNSYDKYVDVPFINFNTLTDVGSYVSGFAWITRSAGVMDTVNTGFDATANISEGICTFFGTASTDPTVGTWKQGDQISKLTATIDGNNMLHGGWWRLTNGSGHVDGTDWIIRYISTVSPAT